ncbi:MAG TPA: hypothetical protein VE909_13395 [Xanthobacteraceae bacterium]|nr:hypothetical protein [Xanthobacteraceae bacterium]
MTNADTALQEWLAGTDASGERAAGARPRLIGFVKRSAEHSEALERVRAWTRARFSLADDAVILVSEVACRLAGCPPVETVVVFWVEEKRHHFKVFKPVADVAMDDLPFGWLRSALVVPEGADCDCC